MSARPVDAWSRREAKRTLKDAAETGFPLSVEEAEVLRMTVAGDPAYWDRGFIDVLIETARRNPRTAMNEEREAIRKEAKKLRDEVRNNPSQLSPEDNKLLRRASRATDITMQQLLDVRERLHAEYARQNADHRSRNPFPMTPARDVKPEHWPNLVRIRRRAAGGLLKDCVELAFYIADAETTGNWMGFGTRDAYLRDCLHADPGLVDLARAALRIQSPPKPPAMHGVRIMSGPQAETPAMEAPVEEWEEIARQRHSAGPNVLHLAATLVFSVDDAETTGTWLGYGSRDAYLRDGLGVEPAVVDVSRKMLRQSGDKT